MNEHLWWYTARASGLVAWALLAACVAWGLFLSSRALGKRPPAPWLLDLHRYLAVLLLAFTGMHLASLVADSYVDFGWSELFVPLTSEWQRGAVAWGVIGMYGLIAIQLTSIYMRRIPKKVWRWVHRSSYAVLVMVSVHAIAAGTDVKSPVVGWAVVVGLVGIAFPVVYRRLVPRKGGRAVREKVARPERVATSAGGRQARVRAGVG